MTVTPIRSLWMNAEMRAALAEYAYLKRTSMGDVVRAAAEGVRDNPTDDSVLSTDDVPSEIHLNVKVSDDIWIAAKNSAQDAGRSLNSLIRRRIRKLLQDERLI